LSRGGEKEEFIAIKAPLVEEWLRKLCQKPRKVKGKNRSNCNESLICSAIVRRL
jgi:hypothetical protein